MYIAHETSLRLTLGAGGPRPLNFYKQKKSPSSRRAFEEQIHFFYSIFGHVPSGAFIVFVLHAVVRAESQSLSLPIIIVYTHICTQKASPAASIKQAPFEVNALMIQYNIWSQCSNILLIHICPISPLSPGSWFAEAAISFVLPSWLFELEFWYQDALARQDTPTIQTLALLSVALLVGDARRLICYIMFI
jgi:hypothetical protein